MPGTNSRLSASLAGSLAFFLIAPGSAVAWIPWAITGWRMNPPLLGISAARWVGAALVAVGVSIVLECFVRFAIKGLGTPAPIAPTEHLVVSGLYRHVRNPMYVGVVAAIIGEALLLGSSSLLAYAALAWVCFFAFVVLYEEPTLQGRFGQSYDIYKANVPRWWPRLDPWRVPEER